jgi:hypothetical protein
VSTRPIDLDALQRDAMHPTPGGSAERRREANRTLNSALEFRKTAQLCRDDGLRLPVISNLHEAARLAITAVAASRGLRFTNRPAAHIAVVDYAIGIKIVNRTEWAQLDELRDLRHKTNYPSDLVEPTDVELDQFGALTDTVLARARSKMAPVPPPPSSTAR